MLFLVCWFGCSFYLGKQTVRSGPDAHGHSGHPSTWQAQSLFSSLGFACGLLFPNPLEKLREVYAWCCKEGSEPNEVQKRSEL